MRTSSCRAVALRLILVAALPAGLFTLLVALIWISPSSNAVFSGVPRTARARVVLEIGAVLGALTMVGAAAQLPMRASRARLVLMSSAIAVMLSLVALAAYRYDQLRRKPHIVMVTIDGFSADRMAFYGGGRQTTPFLDRLSLQSVVALNFYPQSCCTTSGLLALLTGRLPLELKTLYPPHRLGEGNRFRNLPVRLTEMGYRTVQFTESHYSDANELGLRGLDRSNGWRRTLTAADYLLPILRPHAWAIEELVRRFADSPDDRLFESGQRGPHSAADKLAAVLLELEEADRPLFAHAHLLESHGPRFPVAQPVFSAGKADVDWDLDRYDDSLRELDAKLAEFVYQLGVRGLLENTILVVTSDHGHRWSVDERMPLLIFGKGIEPRRVLENSQPIDVAPTLLHLLGETWPSWMPGRAITRSRPVDPWRIVLATRVLGQQPIAATHRWELDRGVPNNGLAQVNAIVCHRSYRLDLNSGALSVKDLPGKFAACPVGSMPAPEALLRSLIEYLMQFGYGPLQPPYVEPSDASKLR